MVDIIERAEFYEARTSVRILDGLHAGPCCVLTGILKDYDNSVWVARVKDGKLDENYVDGKDFIDVMCMEVPYGAEVRFLFDRAPSRVSLPYVRVLLIELKQFWEESD